jgi:hypothetical protein
MSSKNKVIILLIAALLGLLIFTNPSVEAYRGYIKERQGLAGTLGLLAADVLSVGSKSGQGIQRENYLVLSRFYLGGDGVLPRQDLAWGALGRFWELEAPLESRSR